MCGIICLIGDNKEDVERIGLLGLTRLVPRGPDSSNHVLLEVNNSFIFIGFTRLAIRDLSNNGMQPFIQNDCYSITNGEIYNYNDFKKYTFTSTSDCEVILPIYFEHGFQGVMERLDGEFATVVVDVNKNVIYAGRDRYGVRPLYYGYNDGMCGFASEGKVLEEMDFVQQVEVTHFYHIPITDRTNVSKIEHYSYDDYKSIDLDSRMITVEKEDLQFYQTCLKKSLIRAVKRRLISDRPIGFLLSGGLDSSLIVAIAVSILGKDNVVCFTVGMPGSSDVIAATEIAHHLGVKHHIVDFSVDSGFTILHDVIKRIETYDVTTIRASTPQYILAKYISENTDIKVILSGEGSDEVHGSYRYFKDAPNNIAFHQDRVRLVKELCYFDNLRTDRTMAGFGLEVRVPFLDINYVNAVGSIPIDLWSHNEMEKKPLRDAFRNWLPGSLLYRRKEAFSDAVSSKEINWYQSVQKLVENEPYVEYSVNQPLTKDAFYFRRIFNSIYPGRENWVPHYWLPMWQTDIIDPSATILN